MAYKFQIGAAKLSGSVEQTNGSSIKAQTELQIGSVAVDETELGILEGATVTTAELNYLDNDDLVAADIQKLADITSTAAELNLLDGVTGLVQADFTKLAAIDASAAEINELSGFADATYAPAADSVVFLDNDGGIRSERHSDFVDFLTGNGIARSGAALEVAFATDGALAFIGGGSDELSVKLDGSSLSKGADGLQLSSTIPGNRTFSANVIVSGDLTVNGTNTILNTTTLEVEDNNIVIHSGSAPADGAGITIGTSGTPVTLQMSDSAANLQSSVPLKASSFIGALVGNADSATVGTTVTVTDNENTAEENLISFVAGAAVATGNHGLEMDGDFSYNPSLGRVSATAFAGDGSALTGVTVIDQVASVTGTTNVAAAARTILMDAQAGACSVQLPDADGRSGVIYKIKRMDASANACTIELSDATNKLEFITNGNVLLETQGAAVSCVSNGVDWLIM